MIHQKPEKSITHLIKLCSIVFYLFIKTEYTFNTDPLLEVLEFPFQAIVQLRLLW